MAGLTMERAKELLHSTTTEAHLFEHAIGVSAAMKAMARRFGEDEAYWQAVGYLHDYDYEQYPEEHLKHTEEPLRAAGWMRRASGRSWPTALAFAAMWSPRPPWRKVCSQWTSSPA